VTALSLFPTCPLPGCNNVTDDPRQPCHGCLAAFGPMLRQSDAPAPEPEAYTTVIAERDAGVRAVMAGRRDMVPLPGPPAAAQPAPAPSPEPERKRNQVCWVCEQRRTCRIDPGSPNGWICRECEAVDA